jgi:hypothetical protein
MAGMIAMIGTIFIPVFSTSLGMLLAGSFLMGIPWGIFRTSVLCNHVAALTYQKP